MIGRCGKLAPRQDPRSLKLARYLTSDLPPAPESVDWAAGVPSWPMYANNTLGDCTCAAAGHMVDGWRHASRGENHLFTDADVIAFYKTVSGYSGTPDTDRGAVELDVLRSWRTKGLAGHRIGAFASVDTGNHDHIKQAINLFGGCYVGIALPATIYNRGQDECWTVVDPYLRGPAKPGALGGHAVHLCAYTPDRVACVTWGRVQWLSWDFLSAYLDEAYAVLSEDWIGADAKAPVGFDLDELRADLAQVGYLPRQEPNIVDAIEASVEAFLASLLTVLRNILKTEAGKSIMAEIDKAAILAALRAGPDAVAAWLKSPLAEPLHPENRDQPGMGIDGNPGP